MALRPHPWNYQQMWTRNHDLASTTGTTVTSSATAHTKGTRVDLSYGVGQMWKIINLWSEETDCTFLVTVWSGCGFYENPPTVFTQQFAKLIDNILVDALNASHKNRVVQVAVPFFDGQDVMITCQSTATGARSLKVLMNNMMYGQQGYQDISLKFCTTFGATEASTAGTSLDPGAVQHTKGSWVQLSASTPQTMAGFTLGFGAQGNTSRPDGRWLVDLAYGAEGDELPVINNVIVTSNGTTGMISPQMTPWIPVTVPKGSRLVARCSSSHTSSPNRLIDIIAYGYR